MSPVLAFHVTERKNRKSIEKQGLLARDTKEWNYGSDAPARKNWGVKGVYFSFGELLWDSWTSIDPIVFSLDVAGLPIEEDPIVYDPYHRALTDVDPSRVRYVGTYDEAWHLPQFNGNV